MVSPQASGWTQLDGLEPFFSVLAGALEEDRAVLRPVLEVGPELRREERRVVFFGAFKAGKSSLLNALIGAPVLPARAQRTAGAVVSIRHGPAPQAEVVRSGAEPEPISFGDAPDAILAGGDIEEVRIAVPHPMLAGGGVL